MKDLLNAIYQKNLVKLDAILSEDGSVLNKRIPNNQLGHYPLHLATNLSFDSVVRLLLKYQVDPNQTDNNGWSPVHLAALHGHLQVLKTLLSVNVSVNSLTRNLHESLVVIAAKCNQETILRFLLEQKADPLIVTQYGMDAFDIATSNGNLPCLKLLFEHQNSKAAIFNVALRSRLFDIALIQNQALILDYLISKYKVVPNILIPHNSASPEIIYYIKIVNFLFCAKGNLDDIVIIINKLLKENINIRPLIAVIRLLCLKKDSSISGTYGRKLTTKLITLVRSEKLVILLAESNAYQALEIIQNFSDVDLSNLDGQGKSVVTLAIEHDNLELFKAILECFDSKKIFAMYNKDNETILHFTAQKGAVRVMQYLIEEHHMPPGLMNQSQGSLLHHTVRFNQSAMVKLLLHRYSVDVNTVDLNNNNALHIAILNGSVECANVLISANIDTTLSNNENKTPDMLMSERNDNIFLKTKMPYPSNQPVLKKTGPDITILVLQGGGVKGIAFYGALKKLIESKMLDLNKLRISAGTSAGAISALMIALGYDMVELEQELHAINFYKLLESKLKKEFFSIKAELEQHNGIEKFMGKNLFLLLTKIKTRQIDKEQFTAVVTNFFGNRLPLGIINSITRKLGIHDDDFIKIKADIENLKKKLEPFISHFAAGNKGLFAGELLRRQFVTWIEKKGLNKHLTFAQLHQLTLSNSKYKELYVTAYSANESKTQLFSYETTPNTIIADAVRCSMSIQLFFEPHKNFTGKNGMRIEHDKKLTYYDGGSLDNYILGLFDKKRYLTLDKKDPQWLRDYGDNKVSNFHAIGCRLLQPDLYAYYEKGESLETISNEGMLSFLKSIVLSGLAFTKQESDYMLNKDEQKRTIHINTLDINTVEFDITKERKEKLIASGEAAANVYIERAKHSLTHYYSDAEYRIQMPKGAEEKFNYIFQMLGTLDANELRKFLTTLNCPILAFRDHNGNTVLHKAVNKGNVSILEKLWFTSNITNQFHITNNQSLTPLDGILDCQGVKNREGILNFFEKHNLWESKLLNDSSLKFNSNLKKRSYLLKISYKKEKNSKQEIPNLYDENRQKTTRSFLKMVENSNAKFNLSNYSVNDLFNYVYILFLENEHSLMKKLTLSIDQVDNQGMTILHYFVIQNNAKNIEKAFSFFAFPNAVNQYQETPLDMVSKIQSYSTDDSILQQQMMIVFLLKKHAFRCSAVTRSFVVERMRSFHVMDPSFSKTWTLFQTYDQNSNLDDEYKKFLRARNSLEITQEQKNIDTYGDTLMKRRRKSTSIVDDDVIIYQKKSKPTIAENESIDKFFKEKLTIGSKYATRNTLLEKSTPIKPATIAPHSNLFAATSLAQKQSTVFQSLRAINLNECDGPLHQSNTWATGYGIHKTLQAIFSTNNVHIIAPDFSSTRSPKKEKDSIFYAKMIAGYYDNTSLKRHSQTGFIVKDGGELKKPIIFIFNTEFVEVTNEMNTGKIGGSHWVTCVILPKYYQPFFDKYASVNNSTELCYLVNSYHDAIFPAALKKALTTSQTHHFTSDDTKKSYQHFVKAPLPQLQIIECKHVLQQKEPYDCGWWALYNALMIIATGSNAYLTQFKNRSRKPAYVLRTLFPELTHQASLGPEVPKEKAAVQKGASQLGFVS